MTAAAPCEPHTQCEALGIAYMGQAAVVLGLEGHS